MMMNAISQNERHGIVWGQSWQLLVATLALLVSTAISAGILEGRVIAVTDGDTIKVLDASHVQHVIRLSGIDAPEKKMPFGQRSKQNLSDLVLDKQVAVESEKIDRYGRIVGKVHVFGLDANLAQIHAGMAWHYKHYQREQSAADRQSYSVAEDVARSSRLGLWSDVEPAPPWDWRVAQRKH